MFGLFTWFGSMVIALSYLVWVIVFPIMAAWFFLSVRRSLARIAENSSRMAAACDKFSKELDEVPAEHYDGSRPGVLNSMFGR